MSTNRATIKTRDTEVIAGIDKHITAPVTVGWTQYAPADLKAIFQAQITAFDTADAQHTAWRDSVQAAKAAAKKANATYVLLHAFVIGQYGKTANAILNDFGMPVPKVAGAKTVQVKATASAKRAATRTARNTMGSVQKKAVTGHVVGITVTPITATTASAPAQPVTPQPQTVTTAPTAPTAGAPSPVAPAASTPHAS